MRPRPQMVELGPECPACGDLWIPPATWVKLAAAGPPGELFSETAERILDETNGCDAREFGICRGPMRRP